jgi:hypothetical protein
MPRSIVSMYLVCFAESCVQHLGLDAISSLQAPAPSRWIKCRRAKL